MVLLLRSYIVYEKILNNKKDNDNTSTNDNIQNQSQNDNKIDESNFIRDTRVTLTEEPNCTGQHSTSLIANIEFRLHKMETF